MSKVLSGQFPTYTGETNKEKGLFEGMITNNRISMKPRNFRQEQKLTEEERLELKKAKKHWKRKGDNRHSPFFKNGLA